MADQMMRIAGRDDAGLAKAIKTDSNGKVIIGSRSVEEIKIVDVVQIRDTALKTYTVDVSKYKEVSFIVIDSHDAPIKLWTLSNQNISYFDGFKWVQATTNKLTIPVKSYAVLLNDFFPEILDKPWTSISFRVQADTIPTTGTITLLAIGVPN